MTSTLFAPVIEAIDNQSTNIRALFGGPTDLVKGGSAMLGLSHPQIKGDVNKWTGLIVEAETLVDQVIKGRRPLYAFTEAMGTPLFPLLFADSLDRQLYGAYTATPASWKNYCRRAMVNDFRAVKRFATSGIRGLLNPVKELGEHERRTTAEQQFTYSVSKYEAGFGLSFEMMVNDDLEAFARLPQDLAQSALDTEEHFVTTIFAGATGPNATYYNSGNDNVVASNAPLTRAALQAAITRLMSRKDERNNPIMVTAVELVVGPGLLLQAREILDATEYRSVGASGDVTIISGNGVAASLNVSTNFYLGTVTTTNADTSWYLFANPQSSARPAMEIGFLRGYEQPALYERVPDMRRFGGGADVAWSFDHGDAEKKVQHIIGGTFVDPRMTLGSNGTNTP